MDKSSLETATEVMLESINKANIKPEDKIELLINIKCFLEFEHYQRTISLLALDRYEHRFEDVNKPKGK